MTTPSDEAHKTLKAMAEKRAAANLASNRRLGLPEVPRGRPVEGAEAWHALSALNALLLDGMYGDDDEDDPDQ